MITGYISIPCWFAIFRFLDQQGKNTFEERQVEKKYLSCNYVYLIIIYFVFFTKENYRKRWEKVT